jgi:hypothetical protein
LCQASDLKLFIKLAYSTCFASLLSLSTPPRCEAAILVIFNSVSSDVLHHFSLHFKTTPELLSHYPVGMARIIGSFWQRAIPNLGFLRLWRSFAG